MKSFLQAFEESATSRLFEKENNILLFEAENKGENTIELKSGWKRRLHLNTRPEQLGVDWLAKVAQKETEATMKTKVPINSTSDRV